MKSLVSIFKILRTQIFAEETFAVGRSKNCEFHGIYFCDGSFIMNFATFTFAIDRSESR